jgi:CHAD domain-containing protein
VDGALRLIRKRTGGIRDADVAIEKLKGAGWGTGVAAGRRAMIEYLDDVRKPAARRLAGVGERQKIERLPERARKLMRGVKLTPEKAEGSVRAVLRRVKALATKGVANAEDLHRARLVIKRLRYVAELGSAQLGRRSALLVKEARALSDQMGLAQDLVVLAALVGDAIKERPKRARELGMVRARVVARGRRVHRDGVKALAGAGRLEELLG